MTNYSLKHISGPATEPVSLASLKLQANLDPEDTTQDALLEGYISAARRDAENALGRKIGTQIWDIILDRFPCSVAYFAVPLEPLISIDSITYTDEDDVTASVSASAYAYSTDRGLLWLKPSQTWPSVTLQPYGGVRIRVTVGMQPVSDGSSPETLVYPPNIRQAILLRAATMYRVREDVTLGTTLTANEVKAFASLLGSERNIPV